MKHHYYVTTDLDDLEVAETELERAGISASRMHVLTEDTAGAMTHHLHPVNDLMKRDAIHTAMVGSTLGLSLAAIILILASTSGLAAQMGWAPFILISIAVIGFSTWEGGLLGIQRPNHSLLRFMGSIKKGRHVLLVDVNTQQEQALARVVANHPALRVARDGTPDAHSVAQWKKKWHTI
ncbi:MAG TPA: magnesium transporter [Pseudomonadales bacterium]|nr:magnesium transporter [Pseudomonadales bacterium]